LRCSALQWAARLASPLRFVLAPDAGPEFVAI